MKKSLYEQLRAAFPADLTKPFLETPEGKIYSYRDLDEESGRIAALLADLGTEPGERIAVQVEKSPEAIFLYFACLRLGAIYLPLNTAYAPEELSYFLADSRPLVFVGRPECAKEDAAIAGEAGVPSILTLGTAADGSLWELSRGKSPFEPDELPGPDDLCALLYTSGTTGRSKGAMLTQENLASNTRTLCKLWGFTGDDVLLHALPIYHTHGLFVAINCALLSGASMILLPRFDAAEVTRLLPKATVMMGVPTFYTRLLDYPGFNSDCCSSMRLFISGSAPLRAETFHAFQDHCGHTILERYGMTETGMNSSNPLSGERRAGTVGFALPGVELRIVDDSGGAKAAGEVGNLEVRGPNVFKGYWRNREKTEESFRQDGFFMTGDLATFDDDGYLRIVGRGKDLIITGGLNVYPKEVETRIDTLPGVLESAVIGLAHPDFGEAVVAVIVPADPKMPPSESDILDALQQSLAKFKQPKRIFFRDELPRNAMGKVQKNLLREDYRTDFET
jgi:malonyl-CoA/methylmalonyl-CoA synthetase